MPVVTMQCKKNGVLEIGMRYIWIRYKCKLYLIKTNASVTSLPFVAVDATALLPSCQLSG